MHSTLRLAKTCETDIVPDRKGLSGIRRADGVSSLKARWYSVDKNNAEFAYKPFAVSIERWLVTLVRAKA